eukprot:227052-Alexandrium_andersonii.AAC.1
MSCFRDVEAAATAAVAVGEATRAGAISGRLGGRQDGLAGVCCKRLGTQGAVWHLPFARGVSDSLRA